MVVVRLNPPPPPPPLLPARGGFLVLWGLGQRVVLALEVNMAIRITRRVVRKTRRMDGILKTWHNDLNDLQRARGQVRRIQATQVGYFCIFSCKGVLIKQQSAFYLLMSGMKSLHSFFLNY